jgi:hypothetical protein
MTATTTTGSSAWHKSTTNDCTLSVPMECFDVTPPYGWVKQAISRLAMAARRDTEHLHFLRHFRQYMRLHSPPACLPPPPAPDTLVPKRPNSRNSRPTVAASVTSFVATIIPKFVVRWGSPFTPNMRWPASPQILSLHFCQSPFVVERALCLRPSFGELGGFRVCSPRGKSQVPAVQCGKNLVGRPGYLG